MIDTIKAIKKLEELSAQARDGLVSKCRTHSLDELREEAGFIRGIQTALRILADPQEKNGN